MHVARVCPIKAALAGLCSLLVIGGAQAAPVAITNAGFESPALGDGGFTATIDGWVASGGAGRGVFNPNTSQLVAPTEGLQVGYIDPDGHGTASITQTLAETVAAGATYVLEADFAFRKNFSDPSPSFVFTLALLAGGSTVASYTGSVAEGFRNTAFQTATALFTAPANGAVLGTALGVRISANGPFASQITFDNVRINAAPVPLPPTILLLAPGLALLARRARRHRAD